VSAGANLHRLSADVAKLPRTAMIDVAKAAKKVVVERGRAIAGGDGMRGKKRRGLPLKARDTIRTSGTVTTCRVQGSVPGWVWANSGTGAHAIRRRKKGPMRKMTVHHPGTHGTGVWSRVVADIGADMVDVYARRWSRLIG
jgi:hypothetical protein